MNIMKFLKLILLTLISMQIYANSYSPPEWYWDTFSLHQEVGGEDELVDSDQLELKLENCINDLIQSNENCNEAGELLILLSRFDQLASIKYANILLSVIPDDLSNDLYYVRDYAIRALARGGQPEKLLAELGNEEPSLDDALILAEFNDYRWSNYVLESLRSSRESDYCYAIHFITPFLSEKNPNNEDFINAVNINLNSDDEYKSNCTAWSLIGIKEIPVIETSAKSFLFSDNYEKQKIGALFAQRWSFSLTNNLKSISRILEIAATSSDPNTRHVFSNLALNHGFLSQMFNRGKSRSDQQLEVVSTFSNQLEFDVYLANHIFNDIWKDYIINISHIDISFFLLNIANANDMINKIEFINSNPQIINNRFLKTLLAQAAVEFNSAIATELLTEIFLNADNFQKNALIGRFPKYFSSEPIRSITETNPWIRLANLTNLLTICGIEVPPVNSVLADPIKLTKYLEEGSQLLAGCSRVSGKF